MSSIERGVMHSLNLFDHTVEIREGHRKNSYWCRRQKQRRRWHDNEKEEGNNCFMSSRYGDALFHCENDGACLSPLSDMARRMMVIVDDVVSEIVHWVEFQASS